MRSFSPIAIAGFLIFIADARRYLSALDVAGVSLAGVKELILENKESKRLILELEKRVTEMETNR
jgi:hypothetical protein